MHEVLAQLNRAAGIKGSLVVTHDGIVVASRLCESLDEDTTAAHLGNVVTQTKRLLQSASYGLPGRMILTASRGKIVIVELGNCLLVVATGPNANLDLTMLDISSAAKRIREIGTLPVRN